MLAHPLRMRLLGLLRIGGPATATALARRLGTNSGQPDDRTADEWLADQSDYTCG